MVADRGGQGRHPRHAPYRLYVGAPARRVGWVGTEGVRLEPTSAGRWRCPISGNEYVEADGQLAPV